MGVVLDLNYRFWNDHRATEQVGWSHPTKTQPLWANQRIAKLIPELQAAHFTALRMPPSTLAGGGEFSDGYDKKDDYVLDGTAFGSGEMLRQCVATIHAHGLYAYGDLVLHQYGGYPNGEYKTSRFPKTPKCFVGPPPRVDVDDVPSQEGNFPFGDMVSYQWSEPARYMHDGAVDASVWLTRTVGFDGYRIDDVKGTYAPVIYDIIQAINVDYVVGEYFEGSNGPLGNWAHGYMKGLANVLDFGFKFNVRDICNNTSNHWMGRLSEIGYCMVDAQHAMTFVESADTDISPGQQTIWNKMLGYAILLTFPGYPSVYYRDWANDENCYNLKKYINNLVWIHEHFANGDFATRYSSYQVFAMERLGLPGKPGLVAIFNNDQWNEYTVSIPTSHPPGFMLHEYTGMSNTWLDVWTDSRGHITVTVPRNNNGHGYLVFAVPQAPNYPPRPALMTTQEFECAGDLHATGAIKNETRVIARISIDEGSLVHCHLKANQTNWHEGSSIGFRLVHDASNVIAMENPVLDNTGENVVATGTARASGWYGIEMSGSGLPDKGSSATITVSYRAPKTAIL
jgi:alpha-amylase